MQLHSVYLITLGLILYLQNTLCRTCGSEFDNIQSRAYLAAIVFEGIAESETASANGRHNVTFKVGKVFKGKLPTSSDSHKHFKPVVVGEFGDAGNDQCLPVVVTGKKYILFLNESKLSGTPPGRYRMSADPAIASKKHLKRVREMTCKGCGAKPPEVILTAPTEVEEGRKLLIKCRAKGMPPPNIVWAKDGQILSRTKHIILRSNSLTTLPPQNDENLVIEEDHVDYGKGSRLRIRKVKPEDAGSYECQASSVVGWQKKEVNISVTGAHYTKCGEDLKYYCMYGGTCYFSNALKVRFCHCLPNYGGTRCEVQNIPGIRGVTDEDKRASDRTITITAISIGVVVIILVCIAAYIMARKRRAEFFRKKERRQQAALSNAKYTKYPLNVQDDRPIMLSKMTQTTHTEHDDYDHSPPLDTVTDIRPNKPYELSDFPVAPRQPLLSPGFAQQQGEPIRRSRLHAVSNSTPRHVGNSALVNAIVESDQEKSPSQATNKPMNALPQAVSFNGDVNDMLPSNGILHHGDEEDVKGNDPELGYHDNMVNNNMINGNHMSDQSGSSDSEDSDSSSDDADVDQALLKRLKKDGIPANTQGTMLQPGDEESVGNLSWDEYGNALPSYAADTYAFNPYTLDDDIIGNSYLSSPTHNGAQLALLDRLQHVKDNQDPTAV